MWTKIVLSCFQINAMHINVNITLDVMKEPEWQHSHTDRVKPKLYWDLDAVVKLQVCARKSLLKSVTSRCFVN